MCKEMPLIPGDRVVDKRRMIGKKWRAEEEEERHKGPLTHLQKALRILSVLLESNKTLTSGHNPVLAAIGAFLTLVGFFSLQLVFKNFDQVPSLYIF
jgi:hypothetical protein